MERELDANAAQALLHLLPPDGSAIGNSALREALEKKLGHPVGEYAYNALRDRLAEQGSIVKGKGRGGSVRLGKPPSGVDFALASHVVDDSQAARLVRPRVLACAREPRSRSTKGAC